MAAWPLIVSFINTLDGIDIHAYMPEWPVAIEKVTDLSAWTCKQPTLAIWSFRVRSDTFHGVWVRTCVNHSGTEEKWPRVFHVCACCIAILPAVDPLRWVTATSNYQLNTTDCEHSIHTIKCVALQTDNFHRLFVFYFVCATRAIVYTAPRKWAFTRLSEWQCKDSNSCQSCWKAVLMTIRSAHQFSRSIPPNRLAVLLITLSGSTIFSIHARLVVQFAFRLNVSCSVWAHSKLHITAVISTRPTPNLSWEFEFSRHPYFGFVIFNNCDFQ